MKEIYEDYISLMRLALAGEHDDDYDGDFERLVALARDHNMTNMLWYALQKNKNVPEDIAAELQRNHNMAVFKCANQKMARNEVEKLFTSAGIRHIFLKGADVSKLYPSEDMREMSDNDVYVDVDLHEKVKHVLTKAGYKFEGHKGHHDVFCKQPFIMIEVHETVLDNRKEIGLDKYFSPPWSHVQGKAMSPSFGLSDNYIFLMGHLFGHFYEGGVGVRFFADMALYIARYGNELDWEKIDSIFSRYGLREIMNNLRLLALHWFADGDGSDIIDEMGEFVFESGIYGRATNTMMHLADDDDTTGGSFFKTIRHLLFLPASEMRRRSKFLDRFIFLLPLAYIVRIFKILFKRFGDVCGWLRGASRIDTEKIKKYKAKMRRFGINF